MRIFWKLFRIICMLIIISFVLNHMHFDLRLADFAKNKALEVASSDTGKQIIHDAIEVSTSVLYDLIYGIKELLLTGEGA